MHSGYLRSISFDLEVCNPRKPLFYVQKQLIIYVPHEKNELCTSSLTKLRWWGFPLYPRPLLPDTFTQTGF